MSKKSPVLPWHRDQDSMRRARRNRSSSKSTVAWFLLWAILIAIFV